MKIEIWSDVMCPFCYIGKRHFEEALSKFDNQNQLEIEWKSFLLDPTIPANSTENQIDYLVQRKGMSREQVATMLANITQMAKDAGLNFDFEKIITANSTQAHRLIQFAKTKGLADELKERLFEAYFTDGKNIADPKILTELGVEIGLDKEELQNAFDDEIYLYQMKQDIQEAQNIGVRGVPFFVFDRKYGISGAQPAEVFLETLEKSFGEWKEKNPSIELQNSKGFSCDINGNCD
ncbi:DsbA family oxidoreductase [Vaginella massiliensis]|uniref:DsbA family oxidoreductase n=1 Tax=Vaginella massiliensis TaxID=1816680 RepID=UPI000837DA31|nr:DsbA family oxidoreductase [Vaginella massiliensis]